MELCPLCNQKAKSEIMPDRDIRMFNCELCGRFNITRYATILLDSYKNEKPKLSAFLKHRTLRGYSTITITEQRVESLIEESVPLCVEDVLSVFPKTISERMDNMLINFSIISDYPGYYIDIVNTQYPLFYTESDEVQETIFMAKEAKRNGYIDMTSESFPTRISLTQKGWDRVATIMNKIEDFSSRQGFIAMWFNNSMDEASEAIKEAITDAGYDPMRIDMAEHNDKICDKIIAEIKRSKFVVCDFTGHRGGVYFEAGFALGLGLPVIWTCRVDQIEIAHFDTRQYNHIVWKTEKELYEKLKNRILATVL